MAIDEAQYATYMKDFWDELNKDTPLYNFISKNSVSNIDVSRPQQ